MRTFTVVMKVMLPEDKAKEIESWGDNITCDTFVHSVIVDHVRDRGMIVKAMVHEIDAYDKTNEVVVSMEREQAIEDLENEVLSGKACINGSCED